MGQQYTLEFEERLNKRILSLCNEQIPDLSRKTGVPAITRDWTPIGKESLSFQNEMASHDQQREEEKSKEVKQIA